MITRHCTLLRTQLRTLLPALLVGLLVCACDGSSSTQPGSPLTVTATARAAAVSVTGDISGLWDASTPDDTLYIYIDQSGHWYGYDYAADGSGDGSNCHYIFGPYTLQALEDHRYLWHDAFGSREISLTRNGDALIYSDAEGHSRLPAVNGVSHADLAVCGRVM